MSTRSRAWPWNRPCAYEFRKYSHIIYRIDFCEKLEIISSAEELSAVLDLRNTIAREYLSNNLLEIYQETIRLSDSILKSIKHTENHLKEPRFS